MNNLARMESGLYVQWWLAFLDNHPFVKDGQSNYFLPRCFRSFIPMSPRHFLSSKHCTTIIDFMIFFFGRGLRLQERRSGQRNVHCKQRQIGGSVWDRNQSLCRVRGRKLLRRDQRVVYERRREPSNSFGSFRRLLGIILLVETWSHGSTRRVPWDKN